MKYDFTTIEQKWQKYWDENKTFKADNYSSKPKYYVLDMFPYPSGAGLHVGHPLGYIASDIYSRYMRHKGYNVLHPMGYDAFGLPAEQYAIEHGKHPAETTKENIKRYRKQLKLIGLSYDWDREFATSDPDYYKWTQWIFLQLFKHWYNKDKEKAEPIETLIDEFERNGNLKVNAANNCKETFTAEQWRSFSEKKKQHVLNKYRLAYKDITRVNWCPELGTVLANDEVQDGLSVRGGYPVYQVEMEQWLLRVTAYADRLLEGLEKLDWSNSIKEIQRNWIGRSYGAEIYFPVADSDKQILIFTTRPDTIYGATFMVLAPEHPLVKEITTDEYKDEVNRYIQRTKQRTERERIADTKNVTGVFTGAYAINPFTEKRIPIWISDYVLITYGTGAIMAVPGHDSRDYAFAKKFNLPIIQVIEGADITEQSYDDKSGKMINSGILNGLEVKDAIDRIIQEVENRKIGRRKVNYKMRDAIFSRQRYWGEPFPIYYKDSIPYPLNEEELPLLLPEIDDFSPTKDGKPPLARAKNWTTKEGYPLEVYTMPGFAGSSAYYIRFMDPKNDKRFVDKDVVEYWRNVDFYLGGMEHAVGHLIYSRFWNKFLFDLGYIVEDEPFKKLVNQGMMLGVSHFVYRIKGTNTFVSYHLKDKYQVDRLYVSISSVKGDILDIEKFLKDDVYRLLKDKDAVNTVKFILEKEVKDSQGNVKYVEATADDKDAKYVCGSMIEKMSKSKYNVINPDDVIAQYGADTYRMYEMFLGPIEQSKPWSVEGIEGIHRFLRKFWGLFFNKSGEFEVSKEEPNEQELRILHKTIKKVTEDIQKLSYNTAISQMMVCVNELSAIKCNKRAILEPLVVLISPFAPHIAEELWEKLGYEPSIEYVPYPSYDEKYIKEDFKQYPVMVNGKKRAVINLPVGITQQEAEKQVMELPNVKKYIEGKEIKKVIFVPNKVINLVVK